MSATDIKDTPRGWVNHKDPVEVSVSEYEGQISFRYFSFNPPQKGDLIADVGYGEDESGYGGKGFRWLKVKKVTHYPNINLVHLTTKEVKGGE